MSGISIIYHYIYHIHYLTHQLFRLIMFILAILSQHITFAVAVFERNIKAREIVKYILLF